MPNFIKNRLIIKGKNAKEIIQKHLDNEGDFDFNTIDRMPDDLRIECSPRTRDGIDLYLASITSTEKIIDEHKIEELKKRNEGNLEDTIELGKRAFENLQKYGFATWFDWSIHHWGCKWNAGETKIDGETIEFLTAWTPPTPIIQKLAEMHKNFSFEHEWADEGNGYATGRAEYKNGECVSFVKFADGSKEAYELSFELWDNANEFRFNEEIGTYEYIGDFQ